MANQSIVALWTNERVTIALAHVAAAFWAVRGGADQEFALSDVPMESSTLFVVRLVGGETHEFRGASSPTAHHEQGLSFLRALSLYWETRT